MIDLSKRPPLLAVLLSGMAGVFFFFSVLVFPEDQSLWAARLSWHIFGPFACGFIVAFAFDCTSFGAPMSFTVGFSSAALLVLSSSDPMFEPAGGLLVFFDGLLGTLVGFMARRFFSYMREEGIRG